MYARKESTDTRLDYIRPRTYIFWQQTAMHAAAQRTHFATPRDDRCLLSICCVRCVMTMTATKLLLLLLLRACIAYQCCRCPRCLAPSAPMRCDAYVLQASICTCTYLRGPCIPILLRYTDGCLAHTHACMYACMH